MAEKTEANEVVGDAPIAPKQNLSGNLTSLTVEELYDKEKFDLSTMEPGDVFELLQYVIIFLFFPFFIIYSTFVPFPLLSPITRNFDSFFFFFFFF
jgi:hypothetical protein